MLTPIAGFAAGFAHVVMGPDHLAALAPIAVTQPRKATLIGARWGLGHGAGVAVLGGLGVIAKDHFDVNAASAWAEFSVGFVLVAMGIWALRRANALVIHDHGHLHHGSHKDASTRAHDDEATSMDAGHSPHQREHAHVHIHRSIDDHDQPDAHAGHARAAFLVGLLHGAAGGGHLLGVLPSLAMSPKDATAYLACYFVAAVAAMALFGGTMGTLAKRAGQTWLKRLMRGSAVAAICVGGLWLVTSWPS